MNNNKRRILHELGLRKAIEDYNKNFRLKKIDFNELNSEFEAGKREEANKQNQKDQEVILNEYN